MKNTIIGMITPNAILLYIAKSLEKVCSSNILFARNNDSRYSKIAFMFINGLISDNLNRDLNKCRMHKIKKLIRTKSDIIQVLITTDSILSRVSNNDICFTAIRNGSCVRFTTA